MTRRARTTEGDIERTERSPRRRGRPSRLPEEALLELESVAGNALCDGKTPHDIMKILEEYVKNNNLGVTIRREDPYQIIARAARSSRFLFVPPLDKEVENDLKKMFSLITVKTVITTSVDILAYQSAYTLLNLIIYYYKKTGKPEIHLGFGGGYVSRRLAKALAGLLCQATEKLPKTLVFHALAGGFDVEEHQASDTPAPSSFWAYFVDNPAIQVETRFVGLHAPGMVTRKDYDYLRKLKGVTEAFERRDEIDILVTAATHWEEGHTQYMRMKAESPESLDVLSREGCVGDMLWQPVTIDLTSAKVRTKVRPMTLFDLSELDGLIKQGKRILLVSGPCGSCHQPKSEVLRSILTNRLKLVTDLVVDSRSAIGLRK